MTDLHIYKAALFVHQEASNYNMNSDCIARLIFTRHTQKTATQSA